MAGMPMADKTAFAKRKVPATGEDADPKKKIANGSAVAPRLPDRDGPAKDAPAGKMAGKPKTSAKGKGLDAKTLKSMKASLGSVGRF